MISHATGHIAALIAWLATLGRGNKNLQDTLDGYLYKTMKDFEAAIAAMRFMGVKLSDAVTKLKTYMHSVYTMPEVLSAFRRRQNFKATYIQLGGVQPGAVGLSNNGSTNVTNMATISSQMAWMREQGIQMKESGASGYYQLRGSTYNCDLCDDEVGFHPNLDEIDTAPYPHPHCKCYRVPVFAIEKSADWEKRKNNKKQENNVEDNVGSADAVSQKELSKQVLDWGRQNIIGQKTYSNPIFGGRVARFTKNSFTENLRYGELFEVKSEILRHIDDYLTPDLKFRFEKPFHGTSRGFYKTQVKYKGAIEEFKDRMVELTFSLKEDGNMYFYFIKII